MLPSVTNRENPSTVPQPRNSDEDNDWGDEPEYLDLTEVLDQLELKEDARQPIYPED